VECAFATPRAGVVIPKPLFFCAEDVFMVFGVSQLSKKTRVSVFWASIN
jgi:hypothetical protein